MTVSKQYIQDAAQILLKWGLSSDCIVKLFSLYEVEHINRAINFFMVKNRYANEDSFLRYLKNLTEVKGDHPVMMSFHRGR